MLMYQIVYGPETELAVRRQEGAAGSQGRPSGGQSCQEAGGLQLTVAAGKPRVLPGHLPWQVPPCWGPWTGEGGRKPQPGKEKPEGKINREENRSTMVQTSGETTWNMHLLMFRNLRKHHTSGTALHSWNLSEGGKLNTSEPLHTACPTELGTVENQKQPDDCRRGVLKELHDQVVCLHVKF